MEPRSLPHRIYPGFAELVDEMGSSPMYRPKSGGRKSESAVTVNRSRALQLCVKNGLMRRELDGMYSLTVVGAALRHSLIKSTGEFSPDRFLDGLGEEIIVGLLTMPAKTERWWMKPLKDLDFLTIRPRTGIVDLALDTETVVEWLERTPSLPPPGSIQARAELRQPDKDRIELFRKTVESMWTGETDGFGDPIRKTEEPEPDFDDPSLDWDII
jgi:hypothetical protein